MGIPKAKLDARWWKDVKPASVKTRKLDDALDHLQKARKSFEANPQSAALVKAAVAKIRAAVAAVSKECDRREDADVLKALRELEKLALRELADAERRSPNGSGGPGSSGAAGARPGFDVDQLRVLMKRLLKQPLPFAFGIGPEGGILLLDKTQKGQALMARLKGELGCTSATFGMASVEDKVLRLDVEGPKLAGLTKRVRDFLKQHRPMPVTKVGLLGEEAVGEEEEAGAAPTETAGDAARKLQLKASVGRGGRNQPEDVTAVQHALNRNGAQLDTDGLSGPKTIGAIAKFQQSIGFQSPDGRIDPGGRTEAGLNGVKAPSGELPGGGPGGPGGTGSTGPGDDRDRGTGGAGDAPPDRGAAEDAVDVADEAFETAKELAQRAAGEAEDYAKRIAKAIAKERKTVTSRVRDTIDQLAEAERRARERAETEAEERARAMRERLEELYERGEEGVRDTARKVKDYVDDTSDIAKRALEEATRVAGEGLRTARDAADEGADWLRDTWDDLTD